MKASIFAILIASAISVNAQLIVPKPVLDVEMVSSYSIAINWTMPLNELYDEFRVSIQPSNGIEMEEEDPKSLRREFTNLVPGLLYTFIVQAKRGNEYSEPVVILQDTIPLPPTDLQLEYFDELVLTLEGPYFQNTEFTVDVPGINAGWQDPVHGVCECYLAVISPDDGYQAIPGERDEVVVGKKTRQFIHLVPGKTYTIQVHSSTCGEGHRGALRSDPIQADISLPPADPPAIIVEEITPISTRISWPDPPINGYYDDFEVIVVEEPNVVVEEATNPIEPRRNISRLNPCKPYEFQVYTLYQGRRSRNFQRAIVFTKPFPPQSLLATGYTDTSITIQWESGKREMMYFDGYQIDYDSEQISTQYPTQITKDKNLVLSGLEPGTTYSISVKSVCRNEKVLVSEPIIITQTTKPDSPRYSNHVCQMENPPQPEESKKSTTDDAYLSVPWNAPEPSIMTLNWAKPNRGTWDGFVIDYSPYEFEQGVSSPAAPAVVGPNVFSLKVSIPITGYLISASVRAVSNGITSEPLVAEVFCGDVDGEAKRRCKASIDFWNIRITPINETMFLLIEIPNYPFYNATVYANGPIPGYSIFKDHTFTIPNPCTPSSQGSSVTVYPICPPELPYCPTVRRQLCSSLEIRDVSFDPPMPGNACCNARYYNTEEQVCCHGKLMQKRDRSDFDECCISRWYNRKTHKCCAPGRKPGTEGRVVTGRATCDAF